MLYLLGLLGFRVCPKDTLSQILEGQQDIYLHMVSTEEYKSILQVLLYLLQVRVFPPGLVMPVLRAMLRKTGNESQFEVASLVNSALEIYDE